MCIYLYEVTLKKRSAKDLSNDAYAMFFVRFVLIFFIKAYVVGTHYNLIVDAFQMGTHNICLYFEVDKNYTGCNLKTMELLDCTLIGVCVIITSNMVSTNWQIFIITFCYGE